jgi:hypothetical protein
MNVCCRFAAAGGMAVGAVLAAACSGAPAQSEASLDARGAAPAAVAGVPAAELEALRAATERYRDVELALADGYLRDPMDLCITAPMEGQPRQLGAMGVHYFRPDLLGITATGPRVAGTGTHTDFRQPGVLIYEPQADGRLELVAIENLVFASAWREAGHLQPPVFHGNEYYHMIDNPLTEVDEAHMFEPHYELHMWLYRDNPNGLFAPFNPNATCDHHGPAAAHQTSSH